MWKGKSKGKDVGWREKDFLHRLAFSALVGRQEGHPVCKNVSGGGAGVVICLEQGADLHTAQLMQLPLTVSSSVKSRLVLCFWYRLTWGVTEKGPLNGCVAGTETESRRRCSGTRRSGARASQTVATDSNAA